MASCGLQYQTEKSQEGTESEAKGSSTQDSFLLCANQFQVVFKKMCLNHLGTAGPQFPTFQRRRSNVLHDDLSVSNQSSLKTIRFLCPPFTRISSPCYYTLTTVLQHCGISDDIYLFI